MIETIAYLLRWDIEGDGTKINLAVSVDTRDDKENTGAAGTAFEQATQAENNGPFVFLHHLAAWIVKRCRVPHAAVSCRRGIVIPIQKKNTKKEVNKQMRNKKRVGESAWIGVEKRVGSG